MKEFGGNKVSTIDDASRSSTIFANHDPYFYAHIVLRANELWTLELDSATLHLLEGSVVIEGNTLATPTGLKLSSHGETLQAEDTPISLRALSDGATFLVAGMRRPRTAVGELTFTPFDSLKIVSKPWGREVWISGQHGHYCLKKIELNRGNRTSLQYHREKRETNVLLFGTAKLHFKSEPQIENDRVMAADISSTELKPISVLDIFPNTLHRLESLTDIVLYEVSTPQVDDVVRVQDDNSRADGRIASEHGGSRK